MIISLENFDQRGRTKPILNSPRSIEACKRQGIEPEQLLIKTAQQIKKLYKDNYNDHKSLEIKVQHYEARRKSKLQLVRKERIDIITNVKPIYRPNHSTNRSRVQIIEVEDKLEKKKMMDEIKAEIMQKQLAMKEAKINQKISQLEHKKKQKKLEHECIKVENEHRKKRNQMEAQLTRETKINNYLLTEAEKEKKVQQTLMSKQQYHELQKQQKEAYLSQKISYAKELQNYVLQNKRQKVESKFNQLENKLQQKAYQQMLYRRNLEEERRKDDIWKETKRKEAELEERKRQSEVWQALKHKDLKKEQFLDQIGNKKSRYYNSKKEDRKAKEELVKTKQIEEERHIEKKRRIMELVEEDHKRQLQQKKQNERMEIQARREDQLAKERERIEKFKEEEEQKKMQHDYILRKEQERLNQIQKKKQILREQEKQKNLVKELKAKEAEQNRKRLEKIQEFQKQEKLQKFNDKVNQIEQQKRQQKSIKVVRKVSRQEVQSRVLEEHELDRSRSRRGDSYEKPANKIESIKQEAKKNPLKAKEKMKIEEISNLIQNLKIQCNKEEYLMMKEEEKVQKEREQLEKTAQNVAQLRRLQKIHGVERARFQEKLTALMKANQDKVERYRADLVA